MPSFPLADHVALAISEMGVPISVQILALAIAVILAIKMLAS